MQCKKCGDFGVIVESVGPKRTRVKCQKCGWTVVEDERGKPMLVEVPEDDRRRFFVEDWT